MNFKILIIDDAVLMHRLCERALAKLGHTLVFAASVAEAREALASHEPDLLITDIMLPDGRAAEVISRFEEKFPERGVIVMSGGDPSAQDLASLSSRKPVNFLKKPFDWAEMTALITLALTKT